MSTEQFDVRGIFSRAREIQAPADRNEYLDQACGGDAALRAEVDALLAAGDEAGSFMQTTDGWETPTSAMEPLAEGAGTVIGPYKLLQPIGEGGMGAVFMAEQAHPVQRVVALKIIKPGMDSRQVIARFEAERQALALMDHPNIARVLDAGATDSGRPYFVMELVKGVPITQFCDERHLTTRERLELFLPVCQAVQHAHQKGVIHRDIKPTNVLVAEYDDHAVPKVIDFGVAKATSQRLTERTMFTEFGQVIGTVDYMSPEQAKLNQLDIDTRTDVYSLGVLLYELLTGATPFDRQRLRSAAFDEMLRIIREEEPPRPSTRLSGSVMLPSIAANRHVEPQKLTRLVRGELDWIVMKALEKDRNRRYETANGLAGDVDRYLRNEPVQAGPPSAAYRLRKLASRYRGALAIGALLLAVMVVGTIVATWQAVRALRAERQVIRERDQVVAANELKEKALVEKETALSQAQQAERQARIARVQAQQDERQAKTESAKSTQVATFLKEMLQGVSPSVALGRDTTMLREILERTEKRIGKELREQPLVEAELREAIGQAYAALGLYDKAATMHRRALKLRQAALGDESLASASSLNHLGYALWRQGFGNEAEAALRQALAIRRRLLGENHVDVAQSTYDLANLRWYHGDFAESESMHRQALAIRRQLLGDDHVDVAVSLIQLAWVLTKQGRHVDAEACTREAIAIQRTALGDAHPDLAWSLCGLAIALQGQGKLDEAVAVHEQALAMRRNLLGDNHPDVANSLDNLARVQELQGKLPEAEANFRQAFEIQKKLSGQQGAPYSLSSLIGVLRNQGRAAEADALDLELLQANIDAGQFLESLPAAVRAGDKWIDRLVIKAVSQDIEPMTRAIDLVIVGELRLLADDVDSAVAAMRAAVARGPGPPYLYKSLGWSLWSQGKRVEALAAFELALQSCRREDGTFDLDQADPDALTAAFFLDQITEREYVDRFRGRAEMACFPWFYVGQRKEMEGEKPAAIAAYEKCLANGQPSSAHTVRGLAQWRLKRIRP